MKEDFPKEVLKKRKQLQVQVGEERKKDNLTYLKFDKLVTKAPQHDTNRDKRKREEFGFPNTLNTKIKKKAKVRYKTANNGTKTSAK